MNSDYPTIDSQQSTFKSQANIWFHRLDKRALNCSYWR